MTTAAATIDPEVDEHIGAVRESETGRIRGRTLWSADLFDVEKAAAEAYGSPALTVTADEKGETRRLYVPAFLSDANEAKVYCFEDRLEPDPADEPTESRP